MPKRSIGGYLPRYGVAIARNSSASATVSNNVKASIKLFSKGQFLPRSKVLAIGPLGACIRSKRCVYVEAPRAWVSQGTPNCRIRALASVLSIVY